MSSYYRTTIWVALWACFIGIIVVVVEAGIPTDPDFFPLQFVNHHWKHTVAGNGGESKDDSFHYFQTRQENNGEKGSIFWKQRYYTHGEHFQGPGHPILLILGGEGAIAPSTGIFYPVVVNVYAKAFGAFVLQPEHRFYGSSQPISRKRIDEARRQGLPDPRVELFTAEQALYDAVRLTRFVQRYQLGCSWDRYSPHYCPVITIGGSYPGFLSAMARLRFSDVVDMAYAASAPMWFYAQKVNSNAYYNHITLVAEKSVPGCASAVALTLQTFADFVSHFSTAGALDKASHVLGVCPETVPSYMLQDVTTFINEIVMVVAYTLANHNMAYYPPSNQTSLVRSCQTFLNLRLRPLQRLKQFLIDSLGDATVHGGGVRSSSADADSDEASFSCFDLSRQLPSGPNATISAGDWSGVGTGRNGESWDFQTCTLLVESISITGMFFPNRPWTMDWLVQHCEARFGPGVFPQPNKLVQDWKFDDLVGKTNATYILFTNGLNDGWSVSGIQKNLSDTLVALNFPNGAHHSDLSGRGPGDQDTPDIQQGFVQIQQLLASWLEELPSYKGHSKQARLNPNAASIESV